MSAQAGLSRRLDSLKPSATLAIAQRAAELRAQGKNIISFSLGEPDFQPPKAVIDGARAALDTKVSHYTAVGGIKPLKEAIVQASAKLRGIEHGVDEVLVSVGAKHSLFNLALALFDPGDEVIIPAPYWVSYPEQVQITGATPVIVETKAENNFILTADELSQTLNDKTKAIILCSPSNPTGSAYTRKELEALAHVLKQHNCWIISDEIYSRLVYDNFEFTSLLTIAPELKDRMLIVDGVSKTYAMTGWRIGWILGPRAVVEAAEVLQGQSTTNPTAIAQYAALTALTCDQAPVEAMRKEFEVRRNLLIDGLNKIAGVHCRMPQGAFYAFADVREWVGHRHKGQLLEDDVAIARWLLDAAECAVVPGSAFGAPGFLRLSYATSRELIQEGLARIAQAASEFD